MKTSNSIACQSPQFVLLSDSQLQDLHLAALKSCGVPGSGFTTRTLWRC